MLSTSIPQVPQYQRNEIFTRIDKKGFSRYCIVSAISTIISGILYNVNPYIPMILCFICIIAATCISFNFEEIKEEKEAQSIKEYKNELQKGFKFIKKSKRLRALLLMVGTAWGIIALLDIYQLTLLQDIGASSVAIGIIFAILEVTKGLFSNRAQAFNKKFKNKSITNILLTFGVGFIISGIIAASNMTFNTKFIMIVITLLVMGAANAIEQILAKRYVNNFTNNKILPAIYSAKSISDNIFRTISTLIGSIIIGIWNIKISMIVSGVIILVIALGLAMYSKDKLGLKPDEYTQKDIYKR